MALKGCSNGDGGVYQLGPMHGPVLAQSQQHRIKEQQLFVEIQEDCNVCVSGRLSTRSALV